MAQERETGIAGWNAGRGMEPRTNRARSERRRRVGLLVALGVLCVACVVCAWPLKDRISRGLWLKGGTSVSMEAKTGDKAVAPEDLSQAAKTIRKRIDLVGISESRVSARGASGLTIDLPWYVDADAVARAVGGAGIVEFVRLDEIGDADALAKVNAGTSDVALQDGSYTPFIGDASVTGATVTEVASGVYAITFTFDDEGTTAFADVTRELAENTGRIAIVVDGRVVSAPSVSEEIDGGQVSITGDYSEEEANALKALVDTDDLPVGFTVASSEEIGPLVGTPVLWAMVVAAALGFVAVCAVGFVRLKRLGVLLGGAYAVFGCTILGAMVLFSRFDMFVLTLPGVAGGLWCGAVALFSVWMVATRFQAMVLGGMSVRGAATSAVSEGIAPVRIPAALAFVLSCVFLFLPFGGLRDLGTMVIMGTVCGLAAVFWYAVTLLHLVAMGSIQKDPAPWGVARG